MAGAGASIYFSKAIPVLCVWNNAGEKGSVRAAERRGDLVVPKELERAGGRNSDLCRTLAISSVLRCPIPLASQNPPLGGESPRGNFVKKPPPFRGGYKSETGCLKPKALSSGFGRKTPKARLLE